CLFGHDGDGSLRLAPSAKVVGIPRRGAGGLAARGALVKKLFGQNGKNPPGRAFQIANSEAIDCPNARNLLFHLEWKIH
ncbi:MAG: hypothetical protein ACK49I_10555, partial [Verrucomicrobiota bacterium]